MSLHDLFPGYYRPEPAELNAIWEKGVFVFDANVLLHIYRYSPSTREELFDAWNFVRERIWIPHQAAKEFQENRMSVVMKRRERYRQCHDLLNKQLKDAGNYLLKEFAVKSKDDTNPMSLNNMWGEALEYIDFKRISNEYKSAIEYLNQREEAHQLPDIDGKADVLRDRLDGIFGDNIGRPAVNPEQQLATARQRIAAKVPPGYADVGQKDESREANDAVLWLQTLDYASQKALPIIFVTSEVKEDWVWKVNKDKFWGAHPDLVKEMLDVAAVQFVLCSPKQFMEEVSRLRNTQEKLDAEAQAQRETDLRVALAEAQAVEDEEIYGEEQQGDVLAGGVQRLEPSEPLRTMLANNVGLDTTSKEDSTSRAMLTGKVTAPLIDTIVPIGTQPKMLGHLTRSARFVVDPKMLESLNKPIGLAGMDPKTLESITKPVRLNIDPKMLERLTKPTGLGMDPKTWERLIKPTGLGIDPKTLASLTKPIGIDPKMLESITKPMKFSMDPKTLEQLTRPIAGMDPKTLEQLTRPIVGMDPKSIERITDIMNKLNKR